MSRNSISRLACSGRGTGEGRNLTRASLAGLAACGAVAALAALPASAGAMPCQYAGVPGTPMGHAGLESSDLHPHVGEDVTFTTYFVNNDLASQPPITDNTSFEWWYDYHVPPDSPPVTGQPYITHHTFTRAGMFEVNVIATLCPGDFSMDHATPAHVDETVGGPFWLRFLHLNYARIILHYHGLGIKVSYRLSDDAKTTFVVQQALPGVRSSGVCVALTSKNANLPKCTRYVKRGSFTLAGKAGENSFRFTGRVNGKWLAPGSYRLAATARTSTGLTTDTLSSAGFQILP